MNPEDRTMPYPSEIETWWLNAARAATGQDDVEAALAALESAAGQLSDSFTVARPGAFRDYAADARLRAAYGVLFFPQTFMRLRQVLREWRQMVAGGSPVRRVLDLGCGTGASALAAAMELAGTEATIEAVDHAPEALASLRQLFDACRTLWPQVSLEIRVSDVRADHAPGSFDLILASFVMNELFAGPGDGPCEAWLRRQLARLTPGGCLIVVEPAGEAPCTRLQRLRNRFNADNGLRVLAPCRHAGPCPMPGAACGWCHDVRSWRVPDSVNLINRHLFRSVQKLKYGLLILQRAPANGDPGDPARFRLVGPILRTKGRLVTRGCCGDGVLRELELMTRGLSRQQIDALAAWERGDVLRMVGGRPLGDGRIWRVDTWEADPCRCFSADSVDIR